MHLTSRPSNPLLLILVLLVSLSPAFGIDVRSILSDPSGYENEVVTIEGTADRHQRDEATSTDFYILRDDYSDELRVRTSRGLPEVNKRYTIKGVVNLDRTGRPFLHEDQRSLLEPPPPEPPPFVPPPEESQLTPPLIAGLVILGLILVVGIVYFATRKPQPQPEMAPVSPTVVPPGAATQVFETKALRIVQAPGTMRFLPGHFELISGEEKGKKIQLHGFPGERGDEITIGREAPTDPQRLYSHILLKEQTVSRDQAKLTHTQGRYILTNRGTTNPTQVNGQPLGVDETRSLNNGDELRFGEVVFRFHAPGAPGAASAAPQQGGVESKTVLMPGSSGTMKVLTGYFEVLSGSEKGKQIRFQGFPTGAGHEVTIGKAAPEDPTRAYAHILLNEPTVSRKQAKLLCAQGRYTLVNLSSTNHTRINGNPMGVDESHELKDGDQVQFGVMLVQFHL